MSYIRCTSNSEGLYIYDHVNGTTVFNVIEENNIRTVTSPTERFEKFMDEYIKRTRKELEFPFPFSQSGFEVWENVGGMITLAISGGGKTERIQMYYVTWEHIVDSACWYQKKNFFWKLWYVINNWWMIGKSISL